MGSSSYITNLDAQIVQHVEYVPFREVLIEERNQSWNTPYLFKGKELDEETGLYYYGARYYNPREAVWLSTDPLSGYNPVNEFEHYIDGQHNGGVFNSFNLNTYGYCYQNPVLLIDPNGKQSISDIIMGERKQYWLGGELSKEFIGNGETFNAQVYAEVTQLKRGNATLPALYTVKYSNGYNIIKRDDIQYSTNCLGFVLTGGEYYIPGGDIAKFLKASGYKETKTLAYREGDVYLWGNGGHIIEAVKKDGKLVWESFFGGDTDAYYGSLSDILLYNESLGGMSDLKEAKLYRPSQPDVKKKIYESIDVKERVEVIKEFNRTIQDAK
ncbi:RHS repeat domain-containing protein [Apibacter adventoris]|uniref:RHS repeat domain-containing protein n=1 Tax=Apibacter adventoris TaxID=1679466 RepID=UPI001C86D564|nr:RHS repeat-associated core domain-containing protein [Apibacter adventoris]